MDRIHHSTFNWRALENNNRWVRRLLPLMQGRVLDLGCGTAPYREDILLVADEYVGVDWPGTMHDTRRVDVFADLSLPLPFPAECADTVTVFKVLEHLREPALFLGECFRVLRPGGRLIILVPFLHQVHEAPHDYYRYTRFGLEYLLTRSGFTEVSVHEKTGFWEMWVLKWNYHTRCYARGILTLCFIPVWWLGQVVAPWLDRLRAHPEMTASYAAHARKPAGDAS
jgi:SAM-dependent methyltransferase